LRVKVSPLGFALAKFEVQGDANDGCGKMSFYM